MPMATTEIHYAFKTEWLAQASMKQLNAAIRGAWPMLINAVFCLMVYYFCEPEGMFLIGTCFGGSLVMALRDGENAAREAE